MPEPVINALDADSNPELDRILISSNTAAAGPADPPAARRRRKKALPQFLTEEEIARLFKVIDSVRDRAIFRVAYHAGLRASEVGLIDIRDYDAATDRVNITGLKGSNSGQHRMVREEARAFRAWLKLRGTGPGPIFTSNRGLPISRKMLHVLMRKYAERAGIPPRLRHFHALKHTCATHLLARGFNVEQVQDWIRHADIRNTMIYAKVTNGRRDDMAVRLRDWK